MRHTHNAEIITNNNEIIGIYLGADFVSEHEWGIKKMQERLGVHINKNGIIGRQITNGKEIGKQDFKSKGIKGAQLFTKHYSWEDKSEIIPEIPKFTSKDGLQKLDCKWDESHFNINVFNINEFDGCKIVDDLYEAAQKNDLAIWINGSSNPFGRGGLVIAIISKLSERVTNKMLEADLDYLKLRKTVENTGIEKRLENAKRGYFALSPRWKDTLKNDIITEHPIVFWLNPYDQHLYNYGYFTVEELDNWIVGKGKIMKLVPIIK